MRKILFIIIIAFNQSIAYPQQTESIYSKQWEEIDSLIVLKDLPKTALDKVNILYADAKKKNDHDEVIKALLYKLSIDEKVKHNDINQQVTLLKKEFQTADDTISKAIIEILIANNLNSYYEENAWKNNQRKETIGYKEDDITTWSNAQLIQTIDSLFSEALSQKKLLQQTNTSAINAIIIKGNTPGPRPTLYDLIAHEALDYFESNIPYITQPLYSFKLNDVHTLSGSLEFIQYNFSSTDSASHLLKALKLFQELMQFHVTDANPDAFIDVNLERIQWVYNMVNFDDKEALYKNVLLDVTNKFSNTKPAAEAWYHLAQLEADKAKYYEALSDTTGRYGYVKAKQIIEERLKAMPDSCFGNDEMKSLLADISKPELHTQTESVNLTNTAFRIFVQYKNIDTLYAHLLLQKGISKAEKNKKYNEWRDIVLLKPLKTFQQALPQTNDYQQHSVEIKADALPAGDYTILFSSSKDFNNEKDKLATQEFTVSNLAYMRNDFDYFVVDRETGQPLKNVKATGTIEVKNEKKNTWSTKKLKTLYTDSLGHFVIPADKKNKQNYGDADLKLQRENDVLETSDQLYGYRYSYDNNDDDDEDDSTYEDDNSHVYFFTDRSIYRPGQTVFYKGIVLTKDRKTRQNKLYHYTDSVEVDLEDANGKTIDSMFVNLNEYGSFSGKFVLPQNILTGEFTIETLDFTDGEAKFNVEEYKRPTFYVEFDTLKNSYRLNDTITVTGYAKAYAGNNIDNAKLSYNIQRAASFPYPYLFWNTRRPYAGSLEIADSIINIDENGKFEIRFVAAPDSSIDKKTEPLFDFEIELSITDANGETREAKTNIHVAYKSLILQVSVPGIADVHNFKNIFITTKNSADENIPARVDITISPLQTPAKAYRKRLWQQPDQFTMNKEIFETYFPYDEYEKETDYHEWKKLDAVIKDTFNTASTSNYTLKTANLKQGWYCIEASAKDKDGNEVKDVRYMQLYDMNAAGLPSPQINFTQSIRNSGAPGDKAQLLIGTNEKDVFVVEKMNRGEDYAADSFTYIKLDNNKKQLEYTIQPNDHNDIGLYYAFIKHNSFYTGGMRVYINNEEKNLNITYTSFRNITEPGSKETWTVQVNNNKGEKADAELLTSMYDASLDQFKKQQWEIPYFNETHYISNEWKSIALYAPASNENFLSTPSYENKEYSRLTKSGIDFWNIYQSKNNKPITLQSSFTFPDAPANYHKVFGIVKGFKDLKPIQYATVVVKGTKYGTTTNALGEFALAVPPDSKIVIIMAVGYGAVEAKISSGIISASLKEMSSALSEVVVTAYGTALKKDLAGSVAGVYIRGISSLNADNKAIIVIDGVISDQDLKDLSSEQIDNIIVLKGSEAVALYGAKAANGAIVVTTKEFALRNGKKKEEPPQIQVRKNFNETAFFFPQLHADSAGNYSFSFTMPEALTQWKWMSFAHTKDLLFGLRNQNIITQKTLMVQPNLPRFLREGDKIELTAKLSNLSDSILKGIASIQLIDAITNQPLNDSFKIDFTEVHFTAEPNRSTVIKFPVTIPKEYNNPLVIRIIAYAGNYSDGEEKILPVLSNRVLITESLPLYMPGEGSRNFTFEKLLTNNSTTLKNESLTIEYTANPVWYAVQSLPYLIEFPHECAEQTFNRFYANALASFITTQHPAIKKVFENWMKDSTASESNLEKNQELKQVILNETPWVLDAENETQQRKNIALLFDVVKMGRNTESALQQLKQMQMDNGAFAWFKGGYADRYITQYILTGIGKLKKLNAVPAAQQDLLNSITNKALRYLDKESAKEYNELIKNKANLSANQLNEIQIQYWYMRSFFADENSDVISSESFKFYVQQSEQYWMKQSPYMQGMLAVALNRLFTVMKPSSKFKNTQLDIIHSLKENAVTDSLKGMYWKNNLNGYYWYQSAIEAQALLIDAFREILPGDSSINEMSKWLILNKQTNNWQTTKATADACYSLITSADLQAQNLAINIHLGDSVISTVNEQSQAGTGYIKHRINGKDIQPAMGNIEVSVSNPIAKSNLYPPSYGAVYWQYFEDNDKITASSSPLSITKKLFIEKNSDKGKILNAVDNNDSLKVGDKVIIRVVIKTDRDMEYIYLKDMRAASMEPVNVLSEYKWQDGLGYYESTKDAATNFFIDHLTKGTYVFEYPAYITHTGNFSVGVATIQCMYAPEFSAHSEGIKINIKAASDQ